MPTGVPMTTASTVMIRLPTMAFKRPPSAPGGGVISENTLSDSPLNPCHSRTPRISTSQPSPIAVAASDRILRIPSLRRRAPKSLSIGAFLGSPDPPFDAQQQVAHDRQHREDDAEEDQAERDQRGGVEVSH